MENGEWKLKVIKILKTFLLFDCHSIVIQLSFFICFEKFDDLKNY
jgi:hypothetical protein